MVEAFDGVVRSDGERAHGQARVSHGLMMMGNDLGLCDVVGREGGRAQRLRIAQGLWGRLRGKTWGGKWGGMWGGWGGEGVAVIVDVDISVIAEDIGQVLVERSAVVQCHELHAETNTEDGGVGLLIERCEEREFERLTGRVHGLRVGMGGLPERFGAWIDAAGENEPVADFEVVGDLLDMVGQQNRGGPSRSDGTRIIEG